MKNIFIILFFVSISFADNVYNGVKSVFAQEAQTIIFEPMLKSTAYNIKIVNFKKITQNDSIYSDFFDFSSEAIANGDVVPFMVVLNISYTNTFGTNIEKFFDKYATEIFTNGDRAKKNQINLYYTNKNENKMIFKSYELKDKDYSSLKKLADSYNKEDIEIRINFFGEDKYVDTKILNRINDSTNLFYDTMKNKIDDKTNKEDIANNIDEILLPIKRLGMYSFEYIANNKNIYYFVLLQQEEASKLQTLKADIKWK